MSANKFIIYITIIACLLMIALSTFHKVIKDNQKKVNLVQEKAAIEAAYKCYYDGKCSDINKITLNELYTNNYLDYYLVNPKTKEVYSDSSYVTLSKKGAIFTRL